MLRVHSTETFGTQDGPGIRFLLFLQGCNFKCVYCQNRDTREFGGGKEMSDEDLIEMIHREEVYFGDRGGVTVSGGEPLMQAKGLISFFTKLKKIGIHTALDTNASILNDDVKKLLEVTDLVLPDIKHMDNEWHKKVTGENNKSVFEFLDYLEKIKKQFWVRYVLVPGYTDQKESIENMGKYLSKFKFLQRIEILPFHNLGEYKWKEMGENYFLKGIHSPKKEELEEVKNILDKHLKNVYIRI
ncbi:pyruvate formate lyase-activating protein [Candidatus Gracilibacteria bacterium]|nr:pyruvate formate lyase-activating protein [Candidatus Gracilibacteria bacterium]